jgi:Na+-translocating ferredoxin:NAD+ oxidoreductase subunit G
MKDIIKLTLKLFLICAIAAALLGVVYDVTKEPIEQGNLKRAKESRQEVLNSADEFEKVDLSSVGVSTHDDLTGVNVDEAFYAISGGEKIGMTVKVTTKGYNPGIEMTVGISSDGSIEAISIGSHEETPGLGANASKPAFKDQFKGKTPQLNIGSDIDAITSATKTSVGIVNGANVAFEFFESIYE